MDSLPESADVAETVYECVALCSPLPSAPSTTASNDRPYLAWPAIRDQRLMVALPGLRRAVYLADEVRVSRIVTPRFPALLRQYLRGHSQQAPREVVERLDHAFENAIKTGEPLYDALHRAKLNLPLQEIAAYEELLGACVLKVLAQHPEIASPRAVYALLHEAAHQHSGILRTRSAVVQDQHAEQVRECLTAIVTRHGDTSRLWRKFFALNDALKEAIQRFRIIEEVFADVMAMRYAGPELRRQVEPALLEVLQKKGYLAEYQAFRAACTTTESRDRDPRKIMEIATLIIDQSYQHHITAPDTTLIAIEVAEMVVDCVGDGSSLGNALCSWFILDPEANVLIRFIGKQLIKWRVKLAARPFYGAVDRNFSEHVRSYPLAKLTRNGQTIRPYLEREGWYVATGTSGDDEVMAESVRQQITHARNRGGAGEVRAVPLCCPFRCEGEPCCGKAVWLRRLQERLPAEIQALLSAPECG